MSENYIVINGKRSELTKEQMEQLGIEVEENKRWRAADGGQYWFVDSNNEVRSDMEYRYNYDSFRYYSHNYFQTREEAKTYAHVLETEMLLKKYADEHNTEFYVTKYQLYINDNKSLLVAAVYERINKGRIIWFSSKNIASKAIKEIGKNRILEYLTYEW